MLVMDGVAMELSLLRSHAVEIVNMSDGDAARAEMERVMAVHDVLRQAEEDLCRMTGRAVKVLIVPDRRRLEKWTMDELLKVMCDSLVVSVGFIKQHDRKRPKPTMREVFAHVAYSHLNKSNNEIGEFLGGFDHSSVVSFRQNALKRIEVRDEVFMNYWGPVKRELGV
jgi:chromosomal replication initiation ATPase DnaA